MKRHRDQDARLTLDDRPHKTPSTAEGYLLDRLVLDMDLQEATKIAPEGGGQAARDSKVEDARRPLTTSAVDHHPTGALMIARGEVSSSARGTRAGALVQVLHRIGKGIRDIGGARHLLGRDLRRLSGDAIGPSLPLVAGIGQKHHLASVTDRSPLQTFANGLSHRPADDRGQSRPLASGHKHHLSAVSVLSHPLGDGTTGTTPRLVVAGVRVRHQARAALDLLLSLLSDAGGDHLPLLHAAVQGIAVPHPVAEPKTAAPFLVVHGTAAPHHVVVEKTVRLLVTAAEATAGAVRRLPSAVGPRPPLRLARRRVPARTRARASWMGR